MRNRQKRYGGDKVAHVAAHTPNEELGRCSREPWHQRGKRTSPYVRTVREMWHPKTGGKPKESDTRQGTKKAVTHNLRQGGGEIGM